MSDPAKYRTKEEVEKCKIERDPIDGVMNYMLEHKIITQETLDEIEIKVSNEVKSCYAFAEQSPEPELAELYTDVYV
jgi:pyruvate dehydrogenase E1 component alpha subunit